MKTLLCIGAAIILASCGELGRHSDSYSNMADEVNCSACFDKVEYDGCEYIYLRRYASVSLTHKGNCKNPIHIK